MPKEHPRTKTCTLCKVDKPASSYSPRGNVRDGLQSQCRSCRNATSMAWRKNNLELCRARRRANYAANPHRQLGASRKWRFGVTEDEYNEILMFQNGVCAICKEKCREGKALAIDHNHATNYVRGLLCRQCNTALGMLREDPAIVKRAENYLTSTPILKLSRLRGSALAASTQL